MTYGVSLCMSVASAAGTFPDGTHLYGYREDFTAGTGLYEIFPESNKLLWEDANYGDSFTALSSGWIVDNKLCAYAVFSFGAMAMDNTYLEFDKTTGEILATEMAGDAFMEYASYNPIDRTIYGFGYDDMGELSFLKASIDSPTEIEAVKSIEESDNCYGLTYNSAGKYLVGIRGDGSLVRIDSDGTQTLLTSTGYVTSYNAGSSQFPSSALAFSETENAYYWNPQLASYEDVLVRISANDYSITKFDYYDGDQYRFMFAECERVSAVVPAAPRIDNIEFKNGSLSGEATIVMPDKTESGDEFSGTLKWYALVDGVDYSTGSAEAGETVTIPLVDLSQSMHVFSFYVQNGEQKSVESTSSLYVGYDTPAAPTNVVLSSDGTLTWDAVTTGAHNGYVDQAAITYSVIVGGEEFNVENRTTYLIPLPDTTGMFSLVATVTASSFGLTSAPAQSNREIFGEYMITPMEIVPTQDQFYLCQTIGQDGDATGWTFDASQNCFDSGFSIDSKLDDWLILPAIYLEKDKLYYFSMQSRRKGVMYENEKIEVRYGSTPAVDAMTGIIAQNIYPDQDYTQTEASFQIPETGKWYVALHGCSDVNQYGVLVKDIVVTYDGIRSDSPAKVTSLLAKPGANGALEATVSFEMPELTFGGAAIDADTQITATVEGDNVETVSGKPGEEMVVTVRTKQGENVITVTPYIETLPGERSRVNVFTGVHQPADISKINCEVNQNLTAMTVTWEAPDQALDGGYIDPEALTYTVLAPEETMLGTVWNKIAEGLTETNYTYTIENSNLDYYEIAVIAVNAAGESPNAATTGAVLGTPHTLPMIEDFNQPSSTSFFKYDPWVTYVPDSRYNVMWGVLPMKSVPCVSEYQGNACVGQGQAKGDLGKAGFPVFSTKGFEKVYLEIKVWTGESAADDINVTGDTFGMTEPVEVGKVTYNDGWSIMNVELPQSLLDRDWVRLYLNASFPYGASQWVVMSNYILHQATEVTDINSDSVNVKIARGQISIETPETLPYQLVSFDGKKMASGVTSSESKIVIPVETGIYVLSVGEKSYKVNIR